MHREQRCFDGNADGVAHDPATLPRQCYPWLPSVLGGEGHPTPRTTAVDGGQEGGVMKRVRANVICCGFRRNRYDLW